MNKKPTYEELKKRVKEMEEEIKTLPLFSEVNPNIILKADLSGKITYSNPAGHDWLNQKLYRNFHFHYKQIKQLCPLFVSLSSYSPGDITLINTQLKQGVNERVK